MVSIVGVGEGAEGRLQIRNSFEFGLPVVVEGGTGFGKLDGTRFDDECVRGSDNVGEGEGDGS